MFTLNHPVSIHDVYQSPDCTGMLRADDLARLGEHIREGYRLDAHSRAPWEKRTQAAMDLAMQVQKAKSFPWPGCANIAFPLVTISCLQFHSRAYPALVQGPDVVKYRVLGEDPKGEQFQRAQRIGEHMSWQLLESDSAWEEQHDRMLLNVPIVGCAFKKTYFDPSRGGNISELVLASDLVMNYYARSVDTCTRKTHVMQMSRNDIYSAVKEGRFRNVLDATWFLQSAKPRENTFLRARIDRREGMIEPAAADDDTPYTILEQHCWLNLDGDGYAEPWIVTVESESGDVLRLVARWDAKKQETRNTLGELVRIVPTEYFTKYSFIPSPDGGIYDVGFGVLLGPLNSAVNSILNQLVDAGTLQTTAGGFLARGAKIRGGQYQFTPFGWNRVDATGDDLKKSIFPMPVNQPSPVLLQLLNLLVQYTQRISGVTDTLAGENPGQNTPATTTQSMVEQGLKIYSAIFKRLWRAEKDEFAKLYRLNALYLPERMVFGEHGRAVTRQDYLGDPNQIAPVADPHITSDQQQLQRAVAIRQAAASTPGYNLEAVERNFLRALKVDGSEYLYPGPQKTPPLPNPKASIEQIKAQTALQKQQADQQFQMKKMLIGLQEQRALNQAKIRELEAQAASLMAGIDGAREGRQIAALELALGALRDHDRSIQEHTRNFLDAVELNNDRRQQAQQGGGDTFAGRLGFMGRPSGDANPEGSPSPEAGGIARPVEPG